MAYKENEACACEEKTKVEKKQINLNKGWGYYFAVCSNSVKLFNEPIYHKIK